MREFMTRVSDYFNERREDPERKEDRFSAAVIISIVVVIVIVLLLLWRGYTTQVKKQKEEEAAQKAQELLEEQNLVAVTYEEEMEKYMSQNAEEELRQEYLASTTDLVEKVQELEAVIKEVQEELTKAVTEYQEEDTGQKEKLIALERETTTVVEKIRSMEVSLSDLSDVVQVIDREKIPVIQKQIEEIRSGMGGVGTDITNIKEQIQALQKEDEALWERLSGVEKTLATALEKNLEEIDQKVGELEKDTDKQVKELEKNLEKLEKELKEAQDKADENMNALASEFLSYRYKAENNTLYLTPNREAAAGEGERYE